MKKIEMITYDMEKIIKTCISNYRKEEIKNKFLTNITEIKKYTELLDSNGKANKIYLVDKHEIVSNTLGKEDMIKLYEEKFSKQKSPGRIYYDQIKALAKLEICPYCNTKQVGELDHFLPKTKYPALSISPNNLVPICADCNGEKKNVGFIANDDTFIHPYYDYLDDEIWLETYVGPIELDKDKSIDINISYKVIFPTSWNQDKNKRVEYTFNKLKLDSVYSNQAVNEIVNQRYLFSDLKSETGVKSLKEYIGRMKKSYEKVNVNGWKTALYRELEKNEWYLEEYI